MPPPPEYTSTAATSDEAAGLMIRSSNGIYAPKATLPIKALTGEAIKMQRQQSGTYYSNKNGSYSQTRSRSGSPETSSSAHTNTVSPAY